MKQGRSLQELAVEIQRQASAKKDYLVDTQAMRMVSYGDSVDLELSDVDSFQINEIAHQQMSAYFEIPWKYYDRMRNQNTGLLAENVNQWLRTYEPENRMIRTLDGNVRAFLSDRYRRIDNVQVAEAVLPIISQIEGAKVESCEVTDNKMYIKVVNPRIAKEVTVGDIVQSGIVISNSEVGLGSVSVSPLIYRLVCSNGMIAQDGAIRKNHIGRANESDIDFSVFRSETIEADDKAFLMKLQDAVTAATNEAIFARLVQTMRDSRDAIIEPRAVPKVVELTSRQVGITQYEQEGILGHLISGGDLSLYGIGNAVTKYAQEVKSYDRSTELEAIGYKVITLAPQVWNSINSAARKEV